jgi:hypothetical protein
MQKPGRPEIEIKRLRDDCDKTQVLRCPEMIATANSQTGVGELATSL